MGLYESCRHGADYDDCMAGLHDAPPVDVGCRKCASLSRGVAAAELSVREGGNPYYRADALMMAEYSLSRWQADYRAHLATHAPSPP